MTEQFPTSALQRRTVVAGAAWTIPVVATAIGAPLAAASDPVTPPAPQYTVALTGASSLTPGIVTRNSAFDATAGITVTGPDNAEWVEVQVQIQSVAHNPAGPALRGGLVAPHGFALVNSFQLNSAAGYSDYFVYRAYNVPPSTFDFTFRSFVNAASPNGYLAVGFVLRAPESHGGGSLYTGLVTII